MTDPVTDPEKERQARLYERIRVDVGRWLDASTHDPGIALAELFAYLADALSTYQDQVGREAYLTWRRYIGVRLQKGRVVIDSDWTVGADATGKRFGLYRAVVVDRVDPQLLGRVQVQVPAVPEAGTAWAAASLPPGIALVDAPAVGATVWVLFEEGDVDAPVWIGVARTVPPG